LAQIAAQRVSVLLSSGVAELIGVVAYIFQVVALTLHVLACSVIGIDGIVVQPGAASVSIPILKSALELTPAGIDLVNAPLGTRGPAGLECLVCDSRLVPK